MAADMSSSCVVGPFMLAIAACRRPEADGVTARSPMTAAQSHLRLPPAAATLEKTLSSVKYYFQQQHLSHIQSNV
jgi:hypothetical protein